MDCRMGSRKDVLLHRWYTGCIMPHNRSYVEFWKTRAGMVVQFEGWNLAYTRALHWC